MRITQIYLIKEARMEIARDKYLNRLISKKHNGLVKVIIPNFHTVTSCEYFFEKYHDLYFSRPCNTIVDFGTIFLDGEYGFMKSTKQVI